MAMEKNVVLAEDKNKGGRPVTSGKQAGKPRRGPGRPTVQPSKELLKDWGVIETASDIKRVCKELLQHVTRKEISTTQCGSCNSLLNTMLRCVEVSEIDMKLRNLESIVAKKFNKSKKKKTENRI